MPQKEFKIRNINVFERGSDGRAIIENPSIKSSLEEELLCFLEKA